MTLKKHSGSCHCQKVKFEAELDITTGTMRCNCSICSKVRAWFKLIEPGAFRLVQGEASLSEYTWVPPGFPGVNLRFQFCKHCGIRTFVHGANNGKGEPFVAVSIAALDDADPTELAGSVRHIDGRHGRYDREPENPMSF